MEVAAGKYLDVTLEKKEALFLYYRLTSYLREQDSVSFGNFMDINDGTLKDHELMKCILEIMERQHPQQLVQILFTLKKATAHKKV